MKCERNEQAFKFYWGKLVILIFTRSPSPIFIRINILILKLKYIVLYKFYY